jgi:dipeptidyl aminopeptidase/acylaminoacyl peptidase
MRKKASILLLVCCALLVILDIHIVAQNKAPRHDNKRIEFESGHFKVVGELRIPSGEGKYPIVKDLDFMAGILPEERWQPKDPEGEGYFNPISIFEQTKIPTLVVLGEKDRNVNPFQAVEAYNKALSKAGNPNFRVELFPGADHNIILCETGCQKERNRRSRKEWANYAPEYLELMESWLKNL